MPGSTNPAGLSAEKETETPLKISVDPEEPKPKPADGSWSNPRASPGFVYNRDGMIVFEQIKTGNGEIAFARSDVDLGLKPESKVKIEDIWYKPLSESRVYWNAHSARSHEGEP